MNKLVKPIKSYNLLLTLVSGEELYVDIEYLEEYDNLGEKIKDEKLMLNVNKELKVYACEIDKARIEVIR